MGAARRTCPVACRLPGSDRGHEGDAVYAEETSLIWKTSTYTDSGSCVEWARPAGGVLVRDTKDRERARVPFGLDAWRQFIDWAAHP
ncbi:DUF397 domain-containing protein [Streptomyces phaeoluteigriseus]|uniref:DUF397 domain-containing protein n=1 Tax=Streptomyces phaeoluteigriseus TaxID=114686 RepID=UPI0036A3CF52